MASTAVRLTRTGLIAITAGIACIVLYSVGLPVWRRASSPTVDMKVLLSVSIDLARRGGDRVKAIREDPSGMMQRVKGETKEGAKEMLTAADLDSHRIIHGGLTKVFPTLKIISEEHDDADLHADIPDPVRSLPEVASIKSNELIPEADITIWIDPLDATHEYTENLTEYVTTMVCVAVSGKPVIGIVHQPFTGETTWSYVGHGLSSNLLTLTYSDVGLEQLKRVIVSRSHAGDVRKFINSTTSFGKKVEVVSAGGAGYKVLQVLHGRADAYVHTTAIKKWDICAGNALVAGMMGRMTTLKDKTIDYSISNNVVNSDGLLVTGGRSGVLHNTFIDEFSSWSRNRGKD